MDISEDNFLEYWVEFLSSSNTHKPQHILLARDRVLGIVENTLKFEENWDK
jgi:hypothetical protein